MSDSGPAAPDAALPGARRKLVIVSGAGRSGTSSAAGSLAYLGYVVPPPELEANAANPRGYFEPRWAINFHKRLLEKASIHTMDTRPWAPELVAKVTTGGGFQRQLTAWLQEAFSHGDHLVVKDPRAFWARRLWQEAAREAGADTSYLTMLRHPTEVIGSRDTHYAANQSEEQRAAGLIKNLAGWINTTLLNEESSRGQPRVFLRYSELLGDWRAAMSSTNTTLGLDIDERQFSRDAHHRIDDFIDPSLHRVKVTWSDIRVPRHLQDLAEQVWGTLTDDAADGFDIDQGVLDELDAARTSYRQLFTDALALAGDEIHTRARQARNQARRDALAEFTKQAAQESSAPAPTQPPAAQRRAEQERRANQRAAAAARARGDESLRQLLARMGGRARTEWHSWRSNR